MSARGARLEYVGDLDLRQEQWAATQATNYLEFMSDMDIDRDPRTIRNSGLICTLGNKLSQRLIHWFAVILSAALDYYHVSTCMSFHLCHAVTLIKATSDSTCINITIIYRYLHSYIGTLFILKGLYRIQDDLAMFQRLKTHQSCWRSSILEWMYIKMCDFYDVVLAICQVVADTW